MIRAVRIVLPGAVLSGDLALPVGTTGLVIFAHGSGSSRHSPRNRFVAQRINAQGLGTLLVDLLTAEEEETDEVTHELRFDIGLLARRVAQVVAWAGRQEQTAHLLIGLFGASTGAAAALVAAAGLPAGVVRTVVSRGGRPDLAMAALPRVESPTLLIVGSMDPVVLELNQEALAQLCCVKQLAVVKGATHLFGEPGALDEVADLAADWFRRHLCRR
jgi:dienelactone hydrolase